MLFILSNYRQKNNLHLFGMFNRLSTIYHESAGYISADLLNWR
ncbi:hypothetical protein HMPREF0758_3949 [Serratia odorifera DSM 4582]|uniref:Uncharacterized protein n=1 Tax=Serratia odorifera DSM 4582 TaxID=667129 RepID=D4E6Z9_SEROD|nr:hypothetical protein HMPREF0758_3949 [Serratia odorifera DSM 4582]